MSNSLWLHGLQCTRLSSPSLSHRVCSNSCPLSQWCYLTISASVAPFSSCPQSCPASESFPLSWLFASGGQRFGASASVLLMNIQDWFPLGLTGLTFLWSQELSRVFSNTTAQKPQLLGIQPFSGPTLTFVHNCFYTAFTISTFVGKMMSLLFNMLSRFLIAFLPRSKHLLILWLQSPSAVILEPKKISTFPHLFVWGYGTGCHDLHFWMLTFILNTWTLIFQIRTLL